MSLSRKGALTIITVATEDKAYVLDVLKLGQAVFSSGLGEILEDKSRKKLMFDCRQDSDALWHQFNVKLTGVLDLQLLEIIYRRENAKDSRPSSIKYARRSQRTDEVEVIYGFAHCLELYVKDEDLIKNKAKREGCVSLGWQGSVEEATAFRRANTILHRGYNGHVQIVRENEGCKRGRIRRGSSASGI